MATHSSILAWNISWTEEPGGLQSMGSKSQTRLSIHTHSQRRAHLSVNFNKDLKEVKKPAGGYLRKCNQAEEQVQSPEVQACPAYLSNSEAAGVAGVKRIEEKDRK